MQKMNPKRKEIVLEAIMQEIKCPKCGEVFVVDEAGYASIVKQVRDKEFNKELEKQKDMAVKLAVSEKEKEKDEEIAKLRGALKENKAQNDLLIADKNNEIENLKEKNRMDQKLAKSEFERISNEKESAVQNAVLQIKKEKDAEIAQLQYQINEKEQSAERAVKDAVQEKEKEIIKLQGRIESEQKEAKLREKSVEDQYALVIKKKDEEIAFYKDFKARQSTKMIGESLEQHCLTEFNRIRMTAFKNAYFEKDNDARSGSKGDFIYRETDDNGVEIISIMFEMKNEQDETATKHKNEDFFKELNKDRNEKDCEYAILVSMLEQDSELYNGGIVDVSYKYPKMYVVRPQCFISIITILRNAALNSLQYKKQLDIYQNQDLDIKNFEDEMNQFKDRFGRNYDLASRKFFEAIDEIDKTITHLEKIKKALTSSENNLRLANDKAQDLSIKRLTKNSPALQAQFNALKREGE